MRKRFLLTIAWDCGNIKNYYNTETVYFAVRS